MLLEIWVELDVVQYTLFNFLVYMKTLLLSAAHFMCLQHNEGEVLVWR